MDIIAFGWAIGVFICPPPRVQLAQLHEAKYLVRDRPLLALVKPIFSTIPRLKIL